MKTNNNNELFPVFLKLNHLHILVIGGGKIALEKLNAILSNSPKTVVTLVSPKTLYEIEELSKKYSIKIIKRFYETFDLQGIDVVIAATGNTIVNEQIRKDTKTMKILLNVADTPDLCDFYLGSIVQKGSLKIAISTNGKSPTFAKRMKEILNDAIPNDTEKIVENLNEIRNNLKGDFEYKVKKLNEITQEYLEEDKSLFSKIKRAALYSFLVIVGILVSHILLSYIPFENFKDLGEDILSNLDENIGWYLLIGFGAQMVDGALGMAYGVSVTTCLLSMGVPAITPAIASASMHASEIFSTGSSSLVYMRYKNINKKMFRILVWPGLVGAVIGVICVSFVSKEYFSLIRPLVAIYTLILGVIIIKRAIMSTNKKNKSKKLGPVAFSGGFLDSVGGGGWGPIVTSSLLAGGRHLRYAVGTSHLAKFFVALTSTITFFFFIGLTHWQIILGLIIGGMLASPFSIYLSTKIPVKKGLLLVGLVIIAISLKTIIQSILKII
jgi:siroheme synthase-like protein